jgi:hypothetical protein
MHEGSTLVSVCFEAKGIRRLSGLLPSLALKTRSDCCELRESGFQISDVFLSDDVEFSAGEDFKRIAVS